MLTAPPCRTVFQVPAVRKVGVQVYLDVSLAIFGALYLRAPIPDRRHVVTVTVVPGGVYV